MGSLSISVQYGGMVVTSSKIVCLICGIACVLAVIISIIGLKSEKAGVQTNIIMAITITNTINFQ
jgi:hypothetical protein